MGGCGGVVVSALDLRSEGRFWSQPSGCFRRQETLLHIVSLHPGVKMGNYDKFLG